MDFNPTFEVCGIRLTLTEICHDAGMRAYYSKGRDAYYDSYYNTLEKFMPNHPALEDWRQP